MTKTHAEFLEELKDYIYEALPEAACIGASGYFELNKIVEKIEKFQAEQKQASDENS